MLAFLKKCRPLLAGAVLGAAGGEHLAHYRNPGNIFIRVDPVKVLRMWPSAPSRYHRCRHSNPRTLDADEAFYILDGGGTFIQNDVHRTPKRGLRRRKSSPIACLARLELRPASRDHLRQWCCIP
jgi:hypothetical protein